MGITCTECWQWQRQDWQTGIILSFALPHPCCQLFISPGHKDEMQSRRRSLAHLRTHHHHHHPYDHSGNHFRMCLGLTLWALTVSSSLHFHLAKEIVGGRRRLLILGRQTFLCFFRRLLSLKIDLCKSSGEPAEISFHFPAALLSVCLGLD